MGYMNGSESVLMDLLSLRYDKVEMNGLETGTERCVEKQRQILMHEGDLCVGLSFISMQQNRERGEKVN